MDAIFGLDRRALDRARVSRDPRFDGKFFIAVTSTRIYCRPVCRCRARSPRTSAIAERGPPRRRRATVPASAAGRKRRRAGRSGSARPRGRRAQLIDEGALDGPSVTRSRPRASIGPATSIACSCSTSGVAGRGRADAAPALREAPARRDEPAHDGDRAAGFGSLRRFNHAFQTTYRRLRARPAPWHPAATTGGRRPRRSRARLRGRGRPAHLPSALRLGAGPRLPGHARGAGRRAVDARATRARSVTAATRSCAYARGRANTRSSCAARGPRPRCSSSVRGARTFDLAARIPRAIALAFQADPLLGPLVARRPGLRIPGAWDPFECAVRAVLGQQVSVAAGRTLAARPSPAPAAWSQAAGTA